MTYEEARQYLENISVSGIVLGLDTMKELLRRLGDPQNQLKFVHIAGTNGKGSVLAFVSTIMEKAGYRIGRYSSPRVYEFEEFLQVNRQNISKNDLTYCVEKVKLAADTMVAEGYPQPTVFEVETAIGMVYFVKESCQLVVLECGMGGLEDATNVITTEVCNVITPIGLDHTKFLGKTIEDIAKAKGGIIKNDMPVIMAVQNPKAEAVIMDICKKADAPLTVTDLTRLNVHEQMETCADGRPAIGFDYQYFKDMKIGLLGRYQLQNACLAIDVARTLDNWGFTVSKEQIREGLESTVWKGRFETIAQNPQVIVDGAHNLHGVEQLKESVEYYFKDRRIVCIMGVLADKDFNEEVRCMAPLLDHIYTITPPDNPRALSAEKLAQCIAQYHSQVTACQSLKEAVDKAYKTANPEDIILIFGSLSYLGAVIQEVQLQKKQEEE